MNQTQFIEELKQFILTHPYYISLEGTHDNSNQSQDDIFNIGDPDGDYEEIQITIEGIA